MADDTVLSELLPGPVAAGIDRFVASARERLGPILRSATLFGSAAEGRHRATSDVNLLLVLSEWDEARLDALREPLRSGQAAIRLSVMFLLEEEVPRAIEAFPVKFADVLRRRRVLVGSDPVPAGSVPRSALVANLRQLLLNLVLRLRERYLLVSLREEQAARAIAEAAGPLRAAAASLLELEGRPAASPREALEAFARELPGDGWTGVLADLSGARERRTLSPGSAPQSLRRLVALAGALERRARALE